MIVISFENNYVQIFFGGTEDTLEKIQKSFVTLKLSRIKQTHSNIVVEASDQLIEADAHFTDKKQLALMISTADCLPIMLYCTETNRVAAIHAGWKGVENKIVIKTLEKLIQTGSQNKKFIFWIGPHIMQDSFEVNEDVYQMLLNSSYSANISYQKGNKFFVNLLQIVESQIIHILGYKPEIHLVRIDTKTSTEFNSHRLNPNSKARNLSFICLKN